VTNLPHDLAAEQCVLGGMILSAGAIADVSEVISPADHYRPAHQIIHEVILQLHTQGAPTDAVAVGDQLRRQQLLSKVGGAPYLHTLIAAVPAAANAGHYARIVAEMAERRHWIEHGQRIVQQATSPKTDVEDIRDLVRRAQLNGAATPSTAKSPRRLILTPASEIEPEPVIWAWDDDGEAGRVPAGSLGLFAGREGTGKSSFLIWMAAKVTTGTLPGSWYGKPRAVIYVAVEDSWKFTIVPRLMAAGADLSLVYRAEVQIIEGDTVSLSLPADNKLLEQAITENDVALIALDPLMSAISDTLDTHVNRQVRQALDPLARLADRTGAVIAGIAHFNKSAGTDASSLVTGSGAFKDVARFIFAFAADLDDGALVISQTKNSLGRSDLPSLAYRIITATVPTAKGDANVGRFVLDGASDRSVQDILYAQTGAVERGERTGAEEYLKKALASGPRRSKEVEEEAREVHGISQRTLKRARADMRIPAKKHGTDWWISLPEHEGNLNSPEGKAPSPAKSAKGAKAAPPGPVGTLGPLHSDADAGADGTSA
jgi:DnaB-like helicase N terminal domain/AAA domain